MTAASAYSVALVGLAGTLVQVEADIGSGLPRTVLVGLPDSALYQARDRCKAAVNNSGFEWPLCLLTINLSPATLPKTGSHYDLAIVAAVLAAQQLLPEAELRRTALLGELSLDGRIRPVRGVLPATLAAEQAGFTRVVVPTRQFGEARLVEGVDVIGVGSIGQFVAVMNGAPVPEVEPIAVSAELPRTGARNLDLADVVGQEEAKWACEVAAAGRHHMMLEGPPGSGKTMLAERLPSLLPDLDLRSSLEVSAIHSLAGFTLDDQLIVRPPYSDPHHSASVPSIVGGGHRVAKPGAISCAHRGVLFLDKARSPVFSTGRKTTMAPCCKAHQGPHLHGCYLGVQHNGKDHTGPCLISEPRNWTSASGLVRMHTDIPGENCWIEVLRNAPTAEVEALHDRIAAAGLVLIDEDEEPVTSFPAGFRQYLRFGEELLATL